MNKLLWKPSEERIDSTNMHQFMDYVNAEYNLMLSSYNDLYKWSIDDIPHFWEAIWNHTGVIHRHSFARVVDDPQKLPGAKWFEGTRLNFAENLLRYRDDRAALSFKGETRDIVSIT